MENDYIMPIRTFFDRLPELHPIPTGLLPSMKRGGPIEAVIFDIYGTLLISSSGDIDAGTTSFQHVKKAFELSGILLDKTLSGHQKEFYQGVVDLLEERITILHKAKKAAGIIYPEIDIREVWLDVFRRLRKASGLPLPDHLQIQDVALVFEILSNPVYPMPGMIETLTRIHAQGLPTGIISNAQFYTPIIMNYFITGQLERTEYMPYFRKELVIYSYKAHRGKPDIRLFDHIRSVLNQPFGIPASKVLYVGNDMLKDILPARQVGFKTALFAGDKRSLRLRERDPAIKNIQPDHIFTDLSQVHDLL